MPQNFLACDREQELCWRRACASGCALLAVGERSSRRIERHCEDDVAFRVIAANQVPDYATIARFRVRHARALGELFGQVVELCAEAGLVAGGVVAVDGTKLHANASHHATRDYARIAAEILAEADAVDRAEDERRGDELSPELSRSQGRRGRLRDAKRRLDERHAQEARAIPGPRPQRLAEARRRLEEDHQVKCDANTAYEAYRSRGVMKTGGASGARRTRSRPRRSPRDRPI